MKWPIVTFEDLIGESGIYCDGDWVESKDQDPKGDVRLVQLADVGDGEYINKSSRFLTSESAKRLRCTYLQPEDILIARMPDPLGRACIFPGDSKACITVVDVCIIRPDRRRVEPKWLLHAINSQQFRHKIAGYISGTTRQRISRGNLSKINFPLPPLAEQKRIATLLDEADAVRRKRGEIIAKLDSLVHSVFLDMFGDPVTNPKGWPTQTLGELASEKGMIVDGPFGSTLKPEAYVPSGIRVIRNFNIQDDSFDNSAYKFVTEQKYAEICRSEVREGDILISTKGTIGNVCLMPCLPGKSVLSASGTVRVRLTSEEIINRQFLVSQMVRPRYKQYIKSIQAGSIQKYLNLAGIRTLTVIVPPMELQERYCSVREILRVNMKKDA